VRLDETNVCQLISIYPHCTKIYFYKSFFISNPRNTNTRLKAKLSYPDQPNTTNTEYTDSGKISNHFCSHGKCLLSEVHLPCDITSRNSVQGIWSSCLSRPAKWVAQLALQTNRTEQTVQKTSRLTLQGHIAVSYTYDTRNEDLSLSDKL
jgi:hypothetical protein